LARPTVSANLNYSFGPFTESIVPVQPAPPSQTSTTAIAAQHLAADIDYLQHPDSAKRSPHITSVIARHTHRHPLGFLAAHGPIGASISTEAVRQDLLEMLQIMNHDMSRSEKISEDVAALRHLPTDSVLTMVPHILKSIYRDMMTQTRAQLQHMNTEVQRGLWGSSNISDDMMRDQFTRAIAELDRAVGYIDQGHLNEAQSVYGVAMSNAGSQLRVFQNAHAESEREKFAAHVGITVLAGFAAAYTGGLATAALTKGLESLASSAAVNFGINVVSTSVSGATFVLSDRLMQSLVFDAPILHGTNLYENTVDLGKDIVTTSALFGWMRGVGAAARAVPAVTGELAPAVNGLKDFSIEYAGLTTFNAATSDDPQQVFTGDFHRHNLAFLLGVKVGNVSALSSAKLIKMLWVARIHPEIHATQRIPLGGVVLFNMNSSVVAATAVSIGLFCLATLTRGNVPVDKTRPFANVLYDTNLLAVLAVIPLFLGADAIMSRLPTIRENYRTILNRYEIPARSLALWEGITNSMYALQLKAMGSDGLAATQKIYQRTKEHHTPGLHAALDRIPLGLGQNIREGFDYYATGVLNLFRAAPIYTEALARSGVIGCNRLAGERNPNVIPAVGSIKDILKARPIELALRAELGPLAIDPITRAISAPADYFLRFVGEVMPSKSGAFLGFWIDISANSSIDIANTIIFNKNIPFTQLFLPGVLISTLVGFANTRISQYAHFTPEEALVKRTQLGIMKSAAFRGVWGSPATNPLVDLAIQGAYGLYAMWQAHQWTTPKSPIPKDVLARLEKAKKRGDLSVATLDSGHGGLGVSAGIQTQLEHGPFKKFTNIFVNVQSAPEMGINRLPTLEDKAAYLDAQIRDTLSKHRLDFVILACHTLSLIYPHTEHARMYASKANPGNMTPVLDINRVSAEMMVRAMRDAPDAQMVMMATPTVVESGYFQSTLKARRVDPSRLVASSNIDLLTSSQNDPSGHATSVLVGQQVKQVLATVENVRAPLLLALNCSQYALIAGVIHDAFIQHGANVKVINPQFSLMHELFGNIAEANHTLSTEVHIRTQVPVSNGLADLLTQVSATVAGAARQFLPPDVSAIPHATSR
jgi:glutamate racemase